MAGRATWERATQAGGGVTHPHPLQENLRQYVDRIFHVITKSGVSCPTVMCDIFFSLREAAAKRFQGESLVQKTSTAPGWVVPVPTARHLKAEKGRFQVRADVVLAIAAGSTPMPTWHASPARQGSGSCRRLPPGEPRPRPRWEGQVAEFCHSGVFGMEH